MPSEKNNKPSCRVFFILAEGFGKIAEEMVSLVAQKWEDAGRPADWYFVCTGCKRSADSYQVYWDEKRQSYLPITEAGHVYKLLRKKGIPYWQLVIEDESDNTEEQVELLPRFIRQGLHTDVHDLSITLVCHDLHVRRALEICHDAGLVITWTLTVQYKGDLRQPLRQLGHMRLPRPLYFITEEVKRLTRRRK